MWVHLSQPSCHIFKGMISEGLSLLTDFTATPRLFRWALVIFSTKNISVDKENSFMINHLNLSFILRKMCYSKIRQLIYMLRVKTLKENSSWPSGMNASVTDRQNKAIICINPT